MRNIVLIAVDTLRPDHLGCYGYDRPTSPHLDRLAADGVRFDASWSASNFTAPAFTSLFTGLSPHQHGVFDFRAQAQASPVQDVLKAAGARTGGVVSFRFFKRLLGRIWGDIEAVTDTRSFNYSKDLPRAVSDGAVEWLEEHGKKGPFALFLHYDGPHMPYRLPDEWCHRFGDVAEADADPEFVDRIFPQDVERLDGGEAEHGMFGLIESVDRGRRELDPTTLQWLIDRYDDSTAYNDAEVGRVLDALTALGLDDDTLVCVISDHGEELMDHGHLAHATSHLYEEVVRTVCLARGPGLPAGRSVARPVSHMDLWPWLLGLAGAADLPDPWRNVDLLDERIAPPIFCIGEFKAAVRQGPHKLVRRRIIPQHGRLKRLRLWLKLALLRELGPELYDLENDPHETRNLSDDSGLRAYLSGILDAHLAESGPDLTVSGAGDLSDAERARIEKEMRDLGYM